MKKIIAKYLRRAAAQLDPPPLATLYTDSNVYGAPATTASASNIRVTYR